MANENEAVKNNGKKELSKEEVLAKWKEYIQKCAQSIGSNLLLTTHRQLVHSSGYTIPTVIQMIDMNIAMSYFRSLC